MEKLKNRKVPGWFQGLYWWADASKLDLDTGKRTIVVQIINCGRWEHWQWLARTYGKDRLKKIIREIPASEFRKGALKLISLLLGISKMKYASRSDYIRAKRGSQKTPHSS